MRKFLPGWATAGCSRDLWLTGRSIFREVVRIRGHPLSSHHLGSIQILAHLGILLSLLSVLQTIPSYFKWLSMATRPNSLPPPKLATSRNASRQLKIIGANKLVSGTQSRKSLPLLHLPLRARLASSVRPQEELTLLCSMSMIRCSPMLTAADDRGTDKRAPTLRVYFRNFIRIFWYF